MWAISFFMYSICKWKSSKGKILSSPYCLFFTRFFRWCYVFWRESTIAFFLKMCCDKFIYFTGCVVCSSRVTQTKGKLLSSQPWGEVYSVLLTSQRAVVFVELSFWAWSWWACEWSAWCIEFHFPTPHYHPLPCGHSILPKTQPPCAVLLHSDSPPNSLLRNRLLGVLSHHQLTLHLQYQGSHPVRLSVCSFWMLLWTPLWFPKFRHIILIRYINLIFPNHLHLSSPFQPHFLSRVM